jgi:diamine N-acetyltransferase
VTTRLPYVLEGERTALAPLDRADMALYATWINDPAVKGGFMDNGLYTLEEEQRFIDALAAESAQGDPTGVRFAIHELDAGDPIGLTGLINLSWRHRRAELVISIGPADKRGLGLGTEAIALTLRWSFEVLSLHNVFIEAIDLGQGTRCWEDAGFKPVGRRREAVLAAGQLRDAVLMDAIATEFGQ